MDVRHLTTRKAVVGLSLVACGLVGGATVAAVSSASAASPAPSSTVRGDAGPDHGPQHDGPQHGREHSGREHGGAGETALTGDTLAKVKAAVSSKYPGATFERVETDRDGVYEAHLTTAAGDRVTVALDRAFAITGTE